MSEERRQQRLQAWVDRELRALLQSEDTAIVRAYVMGLVRGIGFSAASSSRSSAGQVLWGVICMQLEVFELCTVRSVDGSSLAILPLTSHALLSEDVKCANTGSKWPLQPPAGGCGGCASAVPPGAGWPLLA